MTTTTRLLGCAGFLLAAAACLTLVPGAAPAALPQGATGPAATDAPATRGEVANGQARGPAATERCEAAKGPYDLQPGDTFAVACELDLRTAIDGAADLHAALQGELQLAVLARRGDELALQLAMPAAEVAAGSADAAAALRRDLQRPVQVKLSTRGAIRGYRFPAGFAAAHHNHVRSLLAAIRAELGEIGQTQWQTVEADATGEAVVDYRRDGDRIVRTRRGYRGDGVLPQVAGEARLLPSPQGWWQQVEADESWRLDADEAALHLQLDLRLCARLVRSERTAAAAPSPFDWDAAWAPADGSGEGDAGEGDDLEGAVYAEALRGATAASIVAAMAQALARGDADAELHDARRQLVWLLRHRPWALGELQALLQAGSQPAPLVAEVLGAAAASQVPAAQAWLASLLAPGQPAQLLAMRALFATAAPAPATTAAVEAVLADGDRELQGTALLLLGALAARSGEAVDAAALLRHEDFARDRGLLVDWLAALGNAGRPQLLDAVLRHLDAADAEVRAAAIDALRKLDGERVLAALQRAAGQDPSPQVRQLAAQQLQQRRAG